MSWFGKNYNLVGIAEVKCFKILKWDIKQEVIDRFENGKISNGNVFMLIVEILC